MDNAPIEGSLDDRPAPRLGILHIMLLTAAFGVLLMPSRAVMEQNVEAPLPFRTMFIVQWLSHAVLTAIPLASLPAWWVCHRRGEQFPTQPGHYLLIVIGVRALAGVATTAYWLLFRSPPGENASSIDIAVQFAVTGVFQLLIALALVALMFSTREVRWRVLFGLMAVSSLAIVGMQAAVMIARLARDGFPYWYAYANWILLPLFVVTFTMTVVVAIRDWFGPRRDWIHWLGVGIYLLNAASGIFWNIAFRML